MLPASIGLSSYARNAAGTCEELFDNSCRDINFNLYTMDAQTCYDDKHDCINITAASSITKLSNGKCEFPPQPQCKLSDIDTDIGFSYCIETSGDCGDMFTTGQARRSESDPECIYLTSTTCRKGGVEFTPGIDYCKDQVTGECMNMFENNHIARESPSYIMCMDLGINACRGPLGEYTVIGEQYCVKLDGFCETLATGTVERDITNTANPNICHYPATTTPILCTDITDNIEKPIQSNFCVGPAPDNNCIPMLPASIGLSSYARNAKIGRWMRESIGMQLLSGAGPTQKLDWIGFSILSVMSVHRMGVVVAG